MIIKPDVNQSANKCIVVVVVVVVANHRGYRVKWKGEAVGSRMAGVDRLVHSLDNSQCSCKSKHEDKPAFDRKGFVSPILHFTPKPLPLRQ